MTQTQPTTSSRRVRTSVLALAFALTAVTVLLAAMTIGTAHAAPTTFVVNSTGDGPDANPGDGICQTATVGECTLRAAIEEANANVGADTINFLILPAGNNCDATSGVCTISPASGLPFITQAVTVDGYTQPGATPNNLATGSNAQLKIELIGTDIAAGGPGIRIIDQGSTIKGLVINRFGSSGVRVEGTDASGNRVEGNFLGTDANGTAALRNSEGVFITNAPNNVVGGTVPEARNVISGNGGDGVQVIGEPASGNRVEGNLIGTDVSGTADLGNFESGVEIEDASNNVVGSTSAGARNIISGNGEDGVAVSGDGATGNRIEGNYIGTDASGNGALANIASGVRLDDSSDNVVGGTSAGARNVISGNDEGVLVSGTSENRIEGNYIGTNASGTQDLGNLEEGVLIVDASDNIVGGTSAGARNVISGNGFVGLGVDGNGVSIFGAGATGNKVLGNYIGTDASGTTELGNSDNGVKIDGAPNNVVGGTSVAARNVISGNDLSGVTVNGPGASGNRIESNHIGTDASGTADLGNDFGGVRISAAPNNVVGGTSAGARNVISGNGEDGVEVDGFGSSPGTGNRILRNSISDNDGLGINLVGQDDLASGVTPNDPGDSDTNAPNNLQNYPVIVSASTSGGATTIQGTLNSTPNDTFTLQFFSSPAADPSGFGEGETFEGQTVVTTNASGNVAFTFTTGSPVAAGRDITATATNTTTNDTSEFSEAVEVESGPPPPQQPQCSDDVDNDGDGQTDFPNDRGCSTASDNSESSDTPGGGGGGCTINGTQGNDTLSGTARDDTICAKGGNDRIEAFSGNDTIRGGNGNDTITGSSGTDTAQGGSGADTIRGGAGNDDLEGGTGADKLYGETENDTLRASDGVRGNDLADGGLGNDSCTADAGDRKVSC